MHACIRSAVLATPHLHPPPSLSSPRSFDEFGRPRKKESAADREAREKAALDRLNVRRCCSFYWAVRFRAVCKFARRWLARCVPALALNSGCAALLAHPPDGRNGQLRFPVSAFTAAPQLQHPPPTPLLPSTVQARYREEGGRDRSRSPVRR